MEPSAQAADTFNLTINPGIDLQFSAGPQNICSGQNTQAVNLSSSVNGVTFSWYSQSNGITGAAGSGGNTIPVQTLVNGSTQIDSVNYIITAVSGNCPAQTAHYYVAVNPQPQVSLPSPQTICSGASTSVVNLTSGIAGTTFAWSASSGNVTGFTPAGTGAIIPAQTLTNTSASQGSVTYSVVPSVDGCMGAPVNYNITVNPGLVINPVGPQTICSGSSSSEVNPSANNQNASFSWTASAGSYISGFTAQGTGSIPAQTISNTGNAVDSIVYILSANASGCIGNPIQYVLNVNPVPEVVASGSQSVCSGSQTTAVNLSSNVNGTNYSWTAAASPYLSGYIVSGTGIIPVQTIRNTGQVDDSVVYSITPTANGCTGITKHYAITVHPAVNVNINAEANSICSGTQNNIYLSSNYTGAQFSWTVNEPNGVTGATSGSGNLISQTINSSNPNSETVTYIITSTGAACPAQPDTFNLTVNPGINIQFSTGEQNICSGQNTQAVTLSSSVNGVTFSWFSQSNGITGAATSGSNTIPVQTLVNSTWQVDSVNYIISAISGNCPEQNASYHIIVNPQPQISFPAPQTICSGTSTSVIQFSSGIPGTTFAWSATSDSVTGFIPSGTGATIPVQTLTNTSSSQGSVTYSVAPTVDGCAGATHNYIITVNSGVVINPISPQTVCSGVKTAEVNPGANTQNTTFSWTAYAGPYLSGYATQGTRAVYLLRALPIRALLQIQLFILST